MSAAAVKAIASARRSRIPRQYTQRSAHLLAKRTVAVLWAGDPWPPSLSPQARVGPTVMGVATPSSPVFDSVLSRMYRREGVDTLACSPREELRG